jgi:hypothetical protein
VKVGDTEAEYQRRLHEHRQRMRERDWGGPPPGADYKPDTRPVGKVKDLYVCPECGRADYKVKSCQFPKPITPAGPKPKEPPAPKRDLNLWLENLEARWRDGKLDDTGYDRELARWQRAFSETMPTR